MTTVYCAECEWSGPDTTCTPNTAPIKPGDVVPHGTCPECGAPCHDATGRARKDGPELLEALQDAVREISALQAYGRRWFGDDWWPAKDPKYLESLLDLVLKERYDDVIAHAQTPSSTEGSEP